MAMSWTDERVELLRKLWLDGLSASRIATELAGGVTRNAVIGKVHRLGLSGREKTAAIVGTSRLRAKAQQPSSRPEIPSPHVPDLVVRGNTALAVQTQAVPLVHRTSKDVVVSLTENVTIMDLRDTMCRWPVGDPTSSEFRYCGSKAPSGEGPYCTLHSRMAYQPVQDRRRERKIA